MTAATLIRIQWNWNLCECTCGWRIYTQTPRDVVCKQCGSTVECPGKVVTQRNTRDDGTTPESIRSLVFDDWPRWAKLIAKRRNPDDIGVGSTVKRIAAHVGGERFKRLAKWIGIPCGCTTREERWNRLYPYEQRPD